MNTIGSTRTRQEFECRRTGILDGHDAEILLGGDWSTGSGKCTDRMVVGLAPDRTNALPVPVVLVVLARRRAVRACSKLCAGLW